MEAAQEYNEQIKQESVPDAFSVRDGQTDSTYEPLLNLNGDGMMGYVEIPVIDVSIPIYHSRQMRLWRRVPVICSAAVFRLAARVPIVFCGTQRTSKCETFYRSESCGRGRCFYLHVLGKTLAYEVDQILTVLRSRQSLWVSRMG